MNNDFYRPSGNVKDSNRTYVPDMYRQVAAEMQAEDAGTASAAPSRQVQLQDRPMVGVLYTISAGIEGELFPVYVGRNTIGSQPQCDICLRETSVSGIHGLLLARKQKDENGNECIRVSISDNNSSYGTTLNGERLGFDKEYCHNGDLITIGQNYVLLLSLFQQTERLTVAYGFDRIPEPKAEEPAVVTPQPQPQPAGPQFIGGGFVPEADHSTAITKPAPEEEQASVDFYKPTRPAGSDHYNNKTIIL